MFWFSKLVQTQKPKRQKHMIALCTDTDFAVLCF